MARESFEQLMFYFGFTGRRRPEQRSLPLEKPLPASKGKPSCKTGSKTPHKAPKGASGAEATERQREGLTAAAKAAQRLEERSLERQFREALRSPALTKKEAKFIGAHDLKKLVENYGHRIKQDFVVAELVHEARAKLQDRAPVQSKKRKTKAAARTARTASKTPHKAKREPLDVEAIAQTVEQLERDPLAVPQPIAPPGYRPAECSSQGPAWGEAYTEALAEATERAAIEAGDDEERFRVLLRKYFAEHPQFPAWNALERHCVIGFREKHAKRKRRTETSTSETKRALRDVARELGHDIRGSAEHLDRLTLGGQASYWRRVHKRTGSKSALQKARALEARSRAAKKKGRGVATHRAA